MGNVMAADEIWASRISELNREIAECGGEAETVRRLTGYLNEAKANLRAVAYFPAAHPHEGVTTAHNVTNESTQ